MEKLSVGTPDLTQENIERLCELFPQVATEIATGEGHAKAIDFDALRELLGEVAEGTRERYQFTWPGKREAKAEARRPIAKTMRPCPEESVNWDTTENLYIEGDNLDALKILRETYAGKVKMIYIDPPYNTGGDFVYDDDYAMSVGEYEAISGEFDEDGRRLVENKKTNGRFHSDWCSMIYPRLLLARDLLSADGIVFISIDYNENFNLRTIANEVFGSAAFVGEIYWESKTKSQNTESAFDKLQPKAEMILVYGKRTSKYHFNLIKTGKKDYPLQDERGSYREYELEVMNASGVRGRSTMVFEISDGVSIVSPQEGKQWQLGQDQVAIYKAAGDLFIRNGRVILKMRPEGERQDVLEPFWGFFSKKMGTTESAKKELKDIIGSHGFETVKPIEVIKRLCFHATKSGDIILDFFSGTATTAHAVMQLNAEDGGDRKFIMVQLLEETDENSVAYKAGYKSICEIGKERIRRAGAKIAAEVEASNVQLAFGEEPKRVPDIGFRVLKIDSTNLRDTYKTPQDTVQEELFDLVDNLKDGRTEHDLLFEVLPKFRIPYSATVAELNLFGKRVFNVNNGLLLACFDVEVGTDVVEAMARMRPSYAVLRDMSFKGDASAANFEELFKTYSPDTIRTVF